MQEMTATFNFTHGLSPVNRPVRNGSGLTNLVGLKPFKDRLVPLNSIVVPEEGSTISWPFPQILICQRYNFRLEENEIFLYDDDWNAISLIAGIISGGVWHIADFAEFVVFTNGAHTVCWPYLDEETAEITCFQYW